MGQREAEQRERPIYGRSPLSPRPFAAQYKSQRNAPRRSFSHERPTRSPPDAGPTCPGNSRQLQATARTRSMWTFPTRGHHPAGSGAPRPGPRRGFASWIWGGAEAGGPHRIRSPITTRTPGTPNTPRNAVESNAACPPILHKDPRNQSLLPETASSCGPGRVNR